MESSLQTVRVLLTLLRLPTMQLQPPMRHRPLPQAAILRPPTWRLRRPLLVSRRAWWRSALTRAEVRSYSPIIRVFFFSLVCVCVQVLVLPHGMRRACAWRTTRVRTFARR